MKKRLYIKWANKYIDIIEGKYYATYASRAFADYPEYIWPAGPFDTFKEADEEACSLLCDDDSCNILLRKFNTWWRPENGIDIKFYSDKPRLLVNGVNWVETE